MAAEDFDAAAAFEGASSFYANPALFILGQASSLLSENEGPPSAYPFIATGAPPGTTGAEINRACLAQPLIRFPWRQPGVAGDQIRYAVRPRSPYDAGVCIRTDPPDTESWRDYTGGLANLIDVTQNDAAAVFFNRVHVQLPQFAALEIPAGAPPSRLPAFFGGGEFDLGGALLEQKAALAGLSTEELYLRELGVEQVTRALGFDEMAQTYQYRGRSGLNELPIGRLDLAREIQAIRDCEARHGVGTIATANCFQSLMTMAGGPQLLPAGDVLRPGEAVLSAEVYGAGLVAQKLGLPNTPQAVGAVLAAASATGQDLAAVVAPTAATTTRSPDLQPPGAMNVGGSMSLIGGTFGGTALSSVLGLDPDSRASDGPIFGSSGGGGGGGGTGSVIGDWVDSIPVVGPLLGDILEVATSREGVAIAQTLAQRGYIGGTIGDLLAPQQSAAGAGLGLQQGGAMSSGFDLANIALAIQQAAGQDVASTDDNDFDITDINNIPLELLQLLQRNVFGMNTASLPDASNLFRSRPAGAYLPSRIQVRGPDGSIYVLANLGKATRGSREKSVARRLAKDNGLVCRLRGSTQRRSRRRPR